MRIRHLVIDSTGLKLYGEGEWKVRQHGWAKRRTWRKLHISVDADSHKLTAALVTNKGVVDPRALPRLLKQVEAPDERVYGEGACDSRECTEPSVNAGREPSSRPGKALSSGAMIISKIGTLTYGRFTNWEPERGSGRRGIIAARLSRQLSPA